MVKLVDTRDLKSIAYLPVPDIKYIKNNKLDEVCGIIFASKRFVSKFKRGDLGETYKIAVRTLALADTQSWKKLQHYTRYSQAMRGVGF